MSLWPDHLSAEEVFEALSLPRCEGSTGSYLYLFVKDDLMPKLRPADLPVALRWTESLPGRHALPISFDDLMKEIFAAAWRHLDVPNVLPALASALVKRCELHDHVLAVGSFKRSAELISSDEGKRRKLVRAIVHLIPDANGVRDALFFTRGWLLFPEDLPWILSELKAQSDSASRWKWTELVSIVFDPNSTQHVDLVVTESQSIPELRDHLKSMIDPVALDSPEAQRMKEQHEKAQQWEKQSERPVLDPPPKERVKGRLGRFEAGETDAWWMVNLELTLEADSTHYKVELELVLSCANKRMIL